MFALAAVVLAVAAPCDKFNGLDGYLFQIPVQNGDAVFGPRSALGAVRELLGNACSSMTEIERPLCHTFIEHDEQTTSCYVAVPAVGYFFVTKDYMDTYNLVFNRWD